MTTPSAGWYPDPDGSPRSRWWNGIAWTDSYSDGEAAAPAPAATAAPEVAPVETAAASSAPGAGPEFVAPIEHVAPVVPAMPAPAASPYSAPVSPGASYMAPVNPAGAYQAPLEPAPYLSSVGAPMTAPPGTPWNTVWIWLLVVVPMLPSISLLTIDFTAIFSSADMSTSYGMSYALFSSPGYLLAVLSGWLIYGVSVLFAVLDYRELKRRSVPNPFHWAFCFISSIVYVIGRSVVVRRRTGKGISPMWVSIVGYVLLNIFVFFYIIWAITQFVPTYR